MNSTNRADMLNEIQTVAEKYDFDVGGYDDDEENDIFDVLLIQQDKGQEHDK